MSVTDKITDLDTFLVYSIALEEEAAERHDELADTLDVHNNPEVAATFRKLAEYSRLHAQEIRDHAKGRQLPVIAPWDFGWVIRALMRLSRSAIRSSTNITDNYSGRAE